MRAASTALSDYLDANTLGDRIWHLITITPRTGAVVRLTDSGADITHGGATYTAGGSGTAPLVRVGSMSEAAGLEIGSARVSLLCGESALFNGMRLPLAATTGVLDGAAVSILWYFSEPAESISAFVGRVANARPSSTVVELEIESGLAELNIPIPRRVYQPGCGNSLFDSQCSLLAANFRGTGTTSAGSTVSVVKSTFTTQPAGYYDMGTITYLTGANAGLVRAVSAFDPGDGRFWLTVPLPVAPSAGDQFTALPGCDKTLATCKYKFGTDNSARFTGFPYVPKTESAG